jgi:regulation of enolase protein 1 (concanavalin A-like superfamily)
MGPLGPLIDPLNDCQVQMEGEELTIRIPPKLHIFGPVADSINAPRALTEVTGDFVVQVKVPGSIKPGTKPIEQFPITFQGAGLLLWLDPDNYVRLERAAGYSSEGGSLHQVLVESKKDGRPGIPKFVPAREGPLLLRMERRGGQIVCNYSPDGKTWIRVKEWSVNYPARVNIGISASNASQKPFDAKFEDFKVTKGGQVRAG